LALALLSTCATAGRAGTGSASPLLKPDAGIDIGRLANGLSYYLKENADPKGRLLLCLVVKVGSLEERDSERGVAHFLEHMAFRGTHSFPENGIVRYMESIGMNFGAEVNAHTGHDSTVYELEIPSKDDEALQQALAMLRDWADGITLDQAAVDRERGVVLEEERLGRGAGDRVWRMQIPVIYGESLYGRRDPIGTVESIEAQDAASLRAFYERWYRSELMAVIVVGDAKTAKIKGELDSAFASMVAREGPATSPRSLAPLDGIRASVVTDPELDRSNLELGARIPLLWSRTEDDFVRNGTLNVAIEALDARFSEVIRRSGGNELGGASFDTVELSDDALLLFGDVSFKGGDWKPAAALLAAELDRVAAHGFSKEELSRIEKAYLAELEDWKKNGSRSGDWSSRLVRFFSKGVVPISADDRIRLYETIFQSLRPEDCARYATILRKGSERVELLTLPESAAPVPGTGEVEAAIAAATVDLGPWKTETAASGILASMPERVAPIEAPDDAPDDATDEAGLKRLVYANGLTVLLKKTSYKPDEIVMYATARRGTDSLDEAGFINAAFAPSLIPASGFPGISPDALSSLLSGKTLSFRTGIGPRYVSLRASSNGRDLETLMQLVRRTMTDPVVDPGYFSAAKRQAAEYGRNFPNAPENLYQLAVSKALFPDLRRLTLMSREEDASMLDAESMRSVFSALLGSPEGFIFCFSGSFDEAALRALCDTYLGSLPAASPIPATPLRHLLSPKPETITVRAGSEDKAQVVMAFKTPDSATDNLTIDGLDVVAEALTRSLRERIRELKGATYDISATAVTDPDNGYSMVEVSFGCSPSRVDELAAIVRDEAAILGREGIPKAMLKEIVLAFEKDLEKGAEKNSYWASELSRSYAMGEGLRPLEDKRARLDSLTIEWARDAAIRYLDASRLAQFVLVPEKGK
jgi:zinc protease